jgi:FeS assembly SUF system protein
MNALKRVFGAGKNMTEPTRETRSADADAAARNAAGTNGAASGLVRGAGATQELEEAIIGVLRTVYDPEIPIDIYELGLVYSIDLDVAGAALIRMTLTSPMCPVAGELPAEVEMKIRGVAGVSSTQLEVVWDPPWDPSMMSEAARLTLGF